MDKKLTAEQTKSLGDELMTFDDSICDLIMQARSAGFDGLPKLELSTLETLELALKKLRTSEIYETLLPGFAEKDEPKKRSMIE